MSQESEPIDMDMRRPLFGGMNSAAECVTLGHPDKTCDQIAGHIVDQALAINRKAKVAIEMVACNGKVRIGGELSKDIIDRIDVEQAVKDVFNGMLYNTDTEEFAIEVENIINVQSSEIADIVVHEDNETETGAGDQGVMNGYAIYAPEREHMPAAFWYAKRLAIRLWEAAKNGIIPDLYADGKTQVIITDGKISHVTIAIQHTNYWDLKPDGTPELVDPIYEYVIKPVAGDVQSFIVNGNSLFTKGSIWADSAEVGRKIVIDQMGPDVPVGGGSLNGKDPSKVDLTGAVMARHIAKNIVANELADEALVQFAFTIGQLEPDKLIIYVPEWKGNDTPEEWCREHFPLTVEGMIQHLGLEAPDGWSYKEAARFGFYGHPQFPWEKVNNFKE